MTGTTTSRSTAARGTRGKSKKSGRAPLTAAQREAAETARAARIAALHERVTAGVEALTADPAWRAMLEAAARFHAYSLNNQLLISVQAAALGFIPTRAAGFGTWQALGRHVIKGATGLAILAPCMYRTGDPTDQAGAVPDGAPPGVAGERSADAEQRGRVLRGFRVAHVFDLSQTDGEPLPEVRPALLTGDAPAALWDALAAQVAGHGYTLTREPCGEANGITDPAARTVRVRPDVDSAQAVKTLAHELAHIECGHVADGFDYRSCRGRAEAEAESVAYIVTAWAGLDSGGYTVPYVAAWSGGDPAVLRGAATAVTTTAGRILALLDPTGHEPDRAAGAPTALTG